MFISKGDQIFGEMKPYITGADFSIINLEAPIIKDKPTPIKKSGPCLGVAPSTVEVLKSTGFKLSKAAINTFFSTRKDFFIFDYQRISRKIV